MESKNINTQEGNQVTATASERINEVLDQKTTKAISAKVEDYTLKMAKHTGLYWKRGKLVMEVEPLLKDCGWTAKYEDNNGQRYRMTVRWWRKDDSMDSVMMTITIEHKVGARYKQVGGQIEVKSGSRKDNIDTVLSAIVAAADLAVNKGNSEVMGRTGSK